VILVTGSSGFIGSHLMKALGKRAIGYDLKDNKIKNHNILDYQRLINFIVDNRVKIIIHLAAISNHQEVDKDPIRAIETNLIGTYNVLRAAKESHVEKVILASSAAAAQPEFSLYGTTKNCMESFSKLFNNVIITRFYNVYGPGSKSVVNKFVKDISNGKPIYLNGNTLRDYVHVDDVVKTLIKIAASKSSKLMDIGYGKSYTLKELVNIIEKEIGKKATIIQKPALNEIQKSQMNQTYNTSCSISLEKGIKKLINN